MQPLMLEGQVVDPLAEKLEQLEAENRMLEDQLQAAQRQVIEAKRESARAVAGLRKTLGPLFNSLKVLFGEMEAFGIEEQSHAGPAATSRASAVWESWKQRLGGTQARFIQALLEHEELNAAQLRVHCQCRLNTVYDTAVKLNKLGLIQKNGGKYSLRKL